MLDFSYDRGRESVEFFCVQKKDKRLRLVCDCRHSNVWFQDPDNVTLCAGETLGNLEVGDDDTLYFSEADQIGLRDITRSRDSLERVPSP